MDNTTISLIALATSIVSTSVLALSTFFFHRQFKKNHQWNRRKSTHETLNILVLGQFPKTIDELNHITGANILASSVTYAELIKNKNITETNEIDRHIEKVLDVFETISINVKNHVLDDDITYEYLHTMFIRYFNSLECFICKIRKEANDNRLYIEMEYVTKRWQKQRIHEDKLMKKSTIIPTKKKKI